MASSTKNTSIEASGVPIISRPISSEGGTLESPVPVFFLKIFNNQVFRRMSCHCG